MKQELEQKLVKDYPGLFRSYGGDPTETCMSWGCECGDGWFPILWAMCSSLSGLERQDEEKDKLLPYSSYHKRPGKTLRESRRGYVEYNAKRGKRAPERHPLVLDQVKEKFGTLRVYYHGGGSQGDVVRGIVDMAESMSAVTCENCGSTKDVRITYGWVAIRCMTCVLASGTTGGWHPVMATPEERAEAERGLP